MTENRPLILSYHDPNIYKLWGFGVGPLWVMGYGTGMGYESQIPASVLETSKILWVKRDYGVTGLWVRRASTVSVIPPYLFCRNFASAMV
ncbi:hypothetical protein EI94DRAFT_1602813 [Lactarius quietus]|nr:hypothetical protein EI94DRAFT_1602813 [Lactarius quietus]